MDPSPYSAVGFAGHIPGYRDSVGSTYGMAVTRLLSLPNCHGQPSTLKGECCHICSNHTPADCDCCYYDPDRYKAPRFHRYMMPGYAGFIPDSRYYFGRQYRFPCQPPFSKLDINRPRHCSKFACCSTPPPIDKNKKTIASCDTCQAECCHSNTGEGSTTLQESYRSCLKEQCRLAHPLASWPYVVNACDTNHCHQDSTMIMPGYAGFVPFKRGVNGLRYAEATKEGLRRFNRCVKEERDAICLPPGPATMKCCTESVQPNRKIYLEDQGFMNSYTGHLPGHKDRFGESFGRTTTNLKSVLRSHCQ